MHSNLAKELGKCIKLHRIKRSLFQKDLAISLGISAQFLGRIEKGMVMIPEHALLEAINVLSISKKSMARVYQDASKQTVIDLYTEINESKVAS